MPIHTINGQSISYHDNGSGFPLLFGHSYLWDASMWQPQVELLAANGYRCIVPELPSHGQSGRLVADSCDIKDLAELHAGLMQKLDLAHYGIIGLSVGGMWGVELALTYPERVEFLAVLDSYVGEEPKASQQRYLGLIDAVEQQGFVALLLDAIVPMFFAPDTLRHNPVLVSKFMEMLRSYTPEQLSGIATIGRGIFTRASNLECLQELKMPTLFLAGENDVPRPPHEAIEMSKSVAGSVLSIIPKAGHIATLEQPDLVTNALRSFLVFARMKEAA